MSPENSARNQSGERYFPEDLGFDTVGYAAGREPLPDIPAVLRVRPGGADDTALLQAALDSLAARSRAEPRFQGALVLAPGTFRIGGRLRLAASGLVLRGSADLRHPTRLVAAGQGRRTLIEIEPDVPPRFAGETEVVDEIVPAGSRTLSVAEAGGLAVGDRVAVRRPSTEAWITALGMDRPGGPFADLRTRWLPGSRDLRWHRTITALEAGGKLTLDAPITTALERRYGGGTVAKAHGTPLVQVGVEDLVLESEYDPRNAGDEEHSWIAVSLDHVEDAWVRRVTARHFAGSAVRVGARARRVTVQECRSERPVSEIGGYRRQSFLVYGEQVLVRHCVAEAGLNDFAAGFCAAGPNVFRDCAAEAALGPSGTFESWASGVLYERVRVRGAGLRLARDDARSQGGGWTAAHAAAVGCDASPLVAEGPEGAENVVVARAAPRGEGTVPAKAKAADEGAPLFTLPPRAAAPDDEGDGPGLEIVGGRFVVGERAIWGGQVNAGWWLGQLSPQAGRDAGVSITRFAPGRRGPGLTEELPELAARMRREGMRFYGGGPGLWYDRRRDDHSTEARADGQVWAPFYEMPWARSGRGVAWDGLSRYDLTKFNPWYFSRTREFARLCGRHGLVLYHNLYNSHNLLESPAHWVDFPWRPANCHDDTGLPDVPARDAAGAIHVADAFYDVGHAGRRALHRAYIRHTLDQLGAFSPVVFSVAFQFSGPRAFQEFFLDTVAAWEREAGRRVKLALATTRDITDAVLDDPVRAGQVAVVDMRYWQTQPDGTAWAPRGDRNRAFREMTGEQFGPGLGDVPPPTTPGRVYRQVREYRARFPDKAVVAWHGGAGSLPVFMAGGAQALVRDPASGQSQGLEPDQTPFDAFVRDRLSGTAMNLVPDDRWLNDPGDNWCLADGAGTAFLFYSPAGAAPTLARRLPRSDYAGTWFDPHRGEYRPLEPEPRRSWSPGDGLEKPTPDAWLLLLEARP